MADYKILRQRMVDNQLRTSDVTNLGILAAMGEVPREEFLPVSKRATAYIDSEICVRESRNENLPRYQLRPHVFAKMLQLAEIKPSDLVLVVGCTTGYSAAVISHLADSVVGLEEDEEFVQEASDTISELGIDNVAIVSNTLAEGMESEGPYDVIFVEGAVEVVPEKLLAQLKDGGRLVVIRGLGLSGQAYLYRNSGTVSSGIAAFNASAQLIPGSEKQNEFVF